ncbi:hypothetical protein KY362_00960 [Candidatus Woesearchaeota archaeon]|nr:hypothetical protein [Candidatus Woesearchaeota archaeon]
MKRTAIFLIALLIASILIAGCGETAGEAYKRFRGKFVRPSQQITQPVKQFTPIRTLTCSYRESSPQCDGDVVVSTIQNTDCTSRDRRIDCNQMDRICIEGYCREPCREMQSDRYCSANKVKHMETNRRCEQTTIVDEDCSATGKICSGGACIQDTPAEPALAATGAACAAGAACQSGLCIQGFCREECTSTMNGDRCSANAINYTAPGAGMCVRDVDSPGYLCDQDHVAFITPTYFSDCKSTPAGTPCDRQAGGGFQTEGVCAYVTGTLEPTGTCATGILSEREQTLPTGTETFLYVGCAYNPGSPCDSDVSDGEYDPDGTCMSSRCVTT